MLFVCRLINQTIWQVISEYMTITQMIRSSDNKNKCLNCGGGQSYLKIGQLILSFCHIWEKSNLLVPF